MAYDGREFAGWARQAGLRTVQGVLEELIGHLVGRSVDLVCAGRTDAGVHARGQVAHLDVPRATLGHLTCRRLNRGLPADVRITAAVPAAPGFDARFAALWRRYSYRVCDDEVGPAPLDRHRTLAWPRPLDGEAMNRAAIPLLGEHDFIALCKPRPGASTIRQLQACAWRRRPDGTLELGVQADAFCHSMVRSLVGVLLPVGDGRRDPSWPVEVLRSRMRHPAAMVMPPHPLVLEEVGYPPDDLLQQRQALTRQVRR